MLKLLTSKFLRERLQLNISLISVAFEVIKFDSINSSCFIDFMSFSVENFIVNCEFRAKIFSYKASSNPLIRAGNNWRILNCVFNIDYYDGGYANAGIIQVVANNSYNPYMDNCEVNINLYIHKNTTNNTIIQIFQSGNTNYVGYFRNIALFINTYCSSSTSTRPVYIFNGSINISNISVVLQNKGELDLNKFYFLNPTLGASALNGINIYDKDVLGTTIQSTSNSSLMALTTEQMKDPEYLNSIGFPII